MQTKHGVRMKRSRFTRSDQMIILGKYRVQYRYKNSKYKGIAVFAHCNNIYYGKYV